MIAMIAGHSYSTNVADNKTPLACIAALADPILGMGSPLWALTNLTPPAPDLQQGAVVSQQLVDRSQQQEAMPLPPIQHQTSWEQNNLQVRRQSFSIFSIL